MLNLCSIEGCERPHAARGWCVGHYNRWYRTGDTGKPNFVARGEDHHQWAGDRVTYAGAHQRVRVNRGRPPLFACVDCGGTATDWAYKHDDPNELTDSEGRIYSGDPAHYEPKCHSCHKRGDLALRPRRVDSHCPSGHEFTAENTYVTAAGSRQCRACARTWAARTRARKALLKK